MHMAMKREGFLAQEQHFKGRGIGIKGVGFGGQHRCGRPPGNTFYPRYVFSTSFLPLGYHSLEMGPWFGKGGGLLVLPFPIDMVCDPLHTA